METRVNRAGCRLNRIANKTVLAALPRVGNHAVQVAFDDLIKVRVVPAQQRGVIGRQSEIERSVVCSRESIHDEKEQREDAHPGAHLFFRPPINFQSLFINLMSDSVRPRSAIRHAARATPHGGLIKGLTVFATLASLMRMRLTFVFAALILLAGDRRAPAQEKRSWLGRARSSLSVRRKKSRNTEPETARPRPRRCRLPRNRSNSRKSASCRFTSPHQSRRSRGGTEFSERTANRDPAPRFHRSRRHALVGNRAFAEQVGTL